MDNDFNDKIDLVDGASGAGAYPGFIDDNNRRIREWSGIVQYKPSSRLWASYKILSRRQDIRVQKEPDEKVGEGNSLINALSVSLVPAEGLTLSVFGSHENYEVKSLARDAASTADDVYTGDAATVGLNGTYALSPEVDLLFGASQTSADSQVDHEFGDFYLGCSKKISDVWSVDSRYTYSYFDEQNNGNIDNYNAHVFSVGVTGKF